MNGVKFIYVYYNNIIIGTTSNELRAPTVWLLWGGKERKRKGRKGGGMGGLYRRVGLVGTGDLWGREKVGFGFFFGGGVSGKGFVC